MDQKQKLSYRTLLSEMMFAYVSCRPDIGYAITLMLKSGSNPTAFDYSCLKAIAKNLRATKDWGIIFHCNGELLDLPNIPIPATSTTDHKLPPYPTNTTNGKLICFVDATYGNNPTKRRSTTGYAMAL